MHMTMQSKCATHLHIGTCVCVCGCRLEFKEEMLRKRYEEEVGSLAEERAKQEAEEHRSLMAWNDAENLRLRKMR